MEAEFDAVLTKLGRSVTVESTGGETTQVRALIQPVRDRGEEQSRPSPLGGLRQDRFLYMGQAHVPLEDGGAVEEEGARYRIVSAHPIRSGGGETAYWWALLRPMGREEG